MVGFEVVHVETLQGKTFEVLSERFEDDDEGKEYIEEEYLETQSELEFCKETKEETHVKAEPEEKMSEPKKVPKKNRSYQIPVFVESITVTNEKTGKPEHRYRCNICQKSFRSTHNIQYHKYCDETFDKPYQCDQCSVKYRTGYQLKQHQQLHLNTCYACPECNKKFSHDASAKKHLKKHFQTAPPPPKKPTPKGVFPCEICKKIFTRNDYLKKHMICHEQKKRYKCGYCGRCYARNNALKFHMVTAHTERQEFKCKCGKIMTSMQSLARHQIVHSTAKPLKCLICGLRSSRKDNLFRHIRTFHIDMDPKTCIGVEENAELDDSFVEDEDVAIEDETTMIRSQENTLRKNVIVMKESVKNESDKNLTETENSLNTTPLIVIQPDSPNRDSCHRNEEKFEKKSLQSHKGPVQNMKNIDIYRKILMPIEEDEQPEKDNEEMQEYIEYLS